MKLYKLSSFWTNFYLVLGFLCLVFFGLYSIQIQASNQDLNAPSLRHKNSHLQEQINLQILGKIWLRNFWKNNHPYNNIFVQSYVNGLVLNLWNFSDIRTPSLPFVFAIKDKAFNAFAVPGKVIGINTGLINKSDNESQLASVLAHEIAHLQQNHFLRGKQKYNLENQKSLVGLLGGIGLMLSGAGQAGAALIIGSGSESMQNMLKYSRDFEKEADRVGLDIIKKSQFNNIGFIGLLKKLDTNTQVPEFFSYLQTHPLVRNRITEARQDLLAYKNNAKPPYKSSRLFFYTKIHIKADFLSDRDLAKEVDLLIKNPNKNHIDYFRLAVYANKLKQYKLAFSNIKKIYQPQFINHNVLVLYAQLLQKLGKDQQAIRLIVEALKLQPKHYLLTMAIANILLLSGDSSLAIKYMLDIKQQQYYSQSYWRLLARLYSQNQQPIQLEMALAHQSQLQAAFLKANLHLKRAENLAKDKPILLKSIAEKKSQITKISQTYKAIMGDSKK